MCPPAILEIKGVSLGYGPRIILRDVAFGVRAGEFWFFLGANGSGKTTLLSALMSLLHPREGRIARTSGYDRRGHIGYVPQRSEPNPTLPTTVREFVSLGFVGDHAPRRDWDERFHWALRKVGLEGTEKSSYWSLSGGERQRALVARALVRRPRLLLVDEPTNHLDPVAEHVLLEALGRLNREEGLTVIFVTHDLAIAAQYATHVALFHDGRVHAGDAKQILTSDGLKETFGVPFVVRKEANGSVTVKIEAVDPSDRGGS